MEANSNDDRLAEAQELIWSLLDDQISDPDFRRLETMLQEDESIRQLYVQCVQIHVDLQSWFGEKMPAATPPATGLTFDLPLAGSGDTALSDPAY